MRRPAHAARGLLAALVLASSPAAAQSLEAINRDVAAIEGELGALMRDRIQAAAQRSPTYVEERLTDGELYYRLRDYVRASIIFTDIVDNHASHRAYPDALFLLAESLFQAGDHLGARRNFRLVLDRASDSAFRPFVQRALGRLIEIAIHLRDFEGVDEHFQALARLPPSEVEATTAYFKAKYLYSRAVPLEEMAATGEGAARVDLAMVEQARVAFEAVAEGSPYYPQARYFIGVIHSLRGEYPQAIEAFRRTLRSQATTLEAAEVIDLTQLALGRLYYETDQLDQAIEAYQAVPRTSAHFDDALYEIAWVYIRLGDSTRAERALEVLAIASPDSDHIPDGKVLRGNLLLRNGRFDDALTVFREVRNEFGPVERDLSAIREGHDDLPAYFRQLVRENMENFDVNHFLPESARRWVDLQGGDFERATGVLSDLATARRMVRETDELIVRLNAALRASNRTAIFGDLRRHREATTAYRNRLAIVRRQLVAIEEREGRTSPELTAIREQRRRIEAALSGMPVGEDDFLERDDQLLGRYRSLQRQVSALEVEILGMEARITATETFLRQMGAEASNAEAVQTELAQQRQAIVGYRAEIAEIRQLIDIGRIQVGVGDARYERDGRLREEYNRLVAEEHRLGGNSRTEQTFQRILAIETRINQHDGLIDQITEERISEMLRVVEEETAKLAGYRTALQELEGETEEVVGAVTYAAWDEVRGRFYDLVLRADVGRIDVAWARREEHRMRVDMLTRERSRELQALDDEFRDIMDERREGDAQ
ncbi:MAG: tetratricopeptide repeat protein [Myxococcales bacterium]|nr:tetratricopeptide repeat protein [Myxococcales bacterium]